MGRGDNSAATFLAWLSIAIAIGSAAISLLSYLRGRPKVVVGIECSVNIYASSSTVVRYKVVVVNDSATPVTLTDVGLVGSDPSLGRVQLEPPGGVMLGSKRLPVRLDGHDRLEWWFSDDAVKTWSDGTQVAAYVRRSAVSRNWLSRRRVVEGEVRSPARSPHRYPQAEQG